jgi:hypothetical protein
MKNVLAFLVASAVHDCPHSPQPVTDDDDDDDAAAAAAVAVAAVVAAAVVDAAVVDAAAVDAAAAADASSHRDTAFQGEVCDLLQERLD